MISSDRLLQNLDSGTGPGPRKTWTWTLKKTWTWKTWTLKNMDPKKLGLNMRLKYMSDLRELCL